MTHCHYALNVSVPQTDYDGPLNIIFPTAIKHKVEHFSVYVNNGRTFSVLELQSCINFKEGLLSFLDHNFSKKTVVHEPERRASLDIQSAYALISTSQTLYLGDVNSRLWGII